MPTRSGRPRAGAQTTHAALQGIAVALDAIRANRVRAGLTILGVSVGVLVVVLMSAAIHGVNESVAQAFESAGPTSFSVSRFPIVFETCDGTPATCTWLRNPPITIGDADAIAALPSIGSVVIGTSTAAPLRYRGQTVSQAQVQAYTSGWIDAAGGDITAGRNFTTAEDRAGARVVVIDTMLVSRLFGGLDPIGRSITIGGAPFQVIGLYAAPTSFLSGDAARVMVPYETARRDLDAQTDWAGLSVKPRDGVNRDDAVDAVTAVLRARRRLRPATPNTFAIITQDMLFETWGKLTGVFFVVMLALASIGLIVGGVGVIAIMMISVTERTREIGIRKALGATKGTILFQFLVEAVTLTAIGAGIGLLIGWLLSFAIRSATPIQASVPPWSVVAALAGSAITGIAFGLYPAARAARMDPVEALRYE